jgi:hypothetical protein
MRRNHAFWTRPRPPTRGHLTIATASGPRLSRAICQTAGRGPEPGNDLQTGLPRLHRRTGCGRYADCPSRLALGKFLASYRESVPWQCERSVTGKLKVSRKLATIKQVRGRIDQLRWAVDVGVCDPAEDKVPSRSGCCELAGASSGSTAFSGSHSSRGDWQKRPRSYAEPRDSAAIIRQRAEQHPIFVVFMAILVKIQIGEIANHSTDRILDESLRSWRARWRVLRPAGHPMRAPANGRGCARWRRHCQGTNRPHHRIT